MTYPVPTDLHAPVSNIAAPAPQETTEAPVPTLKSFSPAAAAVMVAGVEDLRAAAPRTSSLAVASIAPDTSGLADIGTASFGAGVQLETVHGPDDRVQVQDTQTYPWSANASLLITARDGSQWVGTAWFIAPRTLATAGHCVYIKNSGVPGRDGWVKNIQVMPGRNGATLPFGSATSTQLWTVRGWIDQASEEHDYGAIVLATELGNSAGLLGFASLGDGELQNVTVNVAGYPADRPGTLWYDTNTIAALGTSKVFYDVDTYGGQSGAAVYVIEGEKRLGVAVHAYGGPSTNSGTRITAPVFANFSNWSS